MEIRAETPTDDGEVVATAGVPLANGTASTVVAQGYLTPDDEPAETPLGVTLTRDATITIQLPEDDGDRTDGT